MASDPKDNTSEENNELFPSGAHEALSATDKSALTTRRPVRRRVAVIAIIVSVVIALSIVPELWQHRDYFVRRQFRAVVPGEVYAGAFQGPIPLKNTLDEHRIKTVLSLVAEGTRYDWMEQRVTSERGVQFRRVEMADDMPLDQLLERTEQAVAIMADPMNQLVFVHCRDGKHRTGLVIAVFRVRHCDWNVQQAEAELEKWGAYRNEDAWVYDAFKEYRSRFLD